MTNEELHDGIRKSYFDNVKNYDFILNTPLTREFVDEYYKYSHVDICYKRGIDVLISDFNILYNLISDINKDDNLYDYYFNKQSENTLTIYNGYIQLQYIYDYYLSDYDLYLDFVELDDKDFSIKYCYYQIEDHILNKLFYWQDDIDYPDPEYLEVIKDENDNVINVINKKYG